MKSGSFLCVVVVCVASAASHAWDERGHVIVTRLAAGTMPADMPAWVRGKDNIQRLCYLANEPDRWRGLKAPAMNHWNNPDHYLDVEMLSPFGLSLKTLPRFRYEFVGRLAAERALHPDRFPAEPGRDADKVRLTPGMLPYRMMELYEEIRSGWGTLRAYENDPAHVTPAMLDSARERIIQSMGLLSHYVGDAAQPLHTTEHFNGWTGENPNGYTTDKRFHARIDGGVLAHHKITSASLWRHRRAAIEIPADAVWEALLEHIDRAFRQVEPLYKLEKSGELDSDAGKAFIEDRLLDGGAMLAGIYVAAYRNSRIDDYMVKALPRVDRRDEPPPASQSAEETSAASQPAATEPATSP